MESLPTDYDVIVIGTGMTGSITAAALSRVGQTVLHIDENDYYGEEWASFNLETLSTWFDSLLQLAEKSLNESYKGLLLETETLVPVFRREKASNVTQKWFCEKSEAGKESPCGDRLNDEENKDGNVNAENVADDSKNNEWTREKLMKEHRKFNLDLSPRMLYSRGTLVELLISSNIARYAEFKTVSRVLTWRAGRLEVVPCSRADVFATKHVSVVQKRMLVKMLTCFADFPACMQEFEGFEEKTFVEYLKHKKLDEQLIHYIVYAIAMGSADTSCLEGVEKCKKFLQSLGRYGNTPFITPFYGSGELPQCFCRLCAVFGGVYHLNRLIDGLVQNSDGSIVAIISGGQRLQCKQIVVTSSLCPKKFLATEQKNIIHRAIFITNRSIVEAEKEAVTLLEFPPEGEGDRPVTVMELGGSCQVCPVGLFVVHMTCVANDDSISSEKLFESASSKLFKGEEEQDTRPTVLWQLMWQMRSGDVSTTDDCPANLHVTPGPDAQIDYDLAVAKASEIFKRICPDEEFLPRAPDPDEIVTDFPEPTNTDEMGDTNDNECESDVKPTNVDEAANVEESNHSME